MKRILTSSFLVLALIAMASAPAMAIQNVSAADPTTTTAVADGLANGVNFSADGILTLADNEDIAAGGITTATTNTGTVLFLGTSTVTGVVGSTTNSVALRGVSGGAANEVVTFANNVFATTATVRATGTMTFNGNFTGTTVNFDGNGNVRLADGKTLTAAVTTDTNNTGSLSFLGDGAMVGTVGTTALRVSSLTGGVVGKQVTFSDNVFAVNTYVNQTGTLTFNGNLTGTALNFNGDGLVQVAADKNLAAAITTSTNNTGSIIYKGTSSITSAVGSIAGNDIKQVFVDGGTVTLNSGTDYAVTTTLIRTNTAAGTSGTFKLGQNSTITGNTVVNGAGVFDASTFIGTTSGTADFNVDAGGTLRTTVTTSGGTSTTAGHVIASGATGDANVSSSAKLDVNVQANYVSNGTVYMLVDGNVGGGGVAAPGTTTDNSATLSFAPTVQNNDLVMTVTRANLATLATDANSSAIGKTLNGFTTGATGDMATVMANLDTMSTADSFSSATNQLDADMNGGVNQASFSSTGGSLNTINTRLGNARGGMVAGGGQNGISSGDVFTDAAIWGQGFGAYGDQDDKGGVAGYTTSTWGAVGGFDWKSSERTRLGLSFAYSQSNVDTNGDVSSVDIDGYQGALYGSYEGEPWYLDAMVAFGWNNYDGSRNIQFASINLIAEQEYDGQQYSTKFTFGYPIAIADSWDLVPVVSLFYSHLNLDGFTETGANSISLIVEDQSYDFLQQGLGGKIVGTWIDGSNQKWVPEFHALWLYDYIGDQASSSAAFTGGGSSFTTEGLDPEQSSLNAGAGLTVYPTESLSFSVSYDFEGRSDYTGHAGNATVRYEF